MISLPDPTAATLMSVVIANTNQAIYNSPKKMGRALLGQLSLGGVTLGH